MFKLILSFSFLLISICNVAQVNIKQLEESAPILSTQYMTICEYKLNGILYNGDAIEKSIFGNITYHFENGRKHGTVKTYYKKDIKKAEVAYIKGALIYAKMWHKDGTPISEAYYKKGYQKSLKTWHSNGELKQEEQFRKKGKFVSQIHYYKSGFIKEKGKLKQINSDTDAQLQKSGKWKYYNKKGELKKVEKWKNGKLINKRKK